ncbi:MAG: esterase/lipase superfamily enzyme [Cellvibrionaceae bacterium]|jgi:esterase/lipase superfamily enzyme
MSKTTAADNVTVNEQMVEVLSIAWKALPEMVGEDWEQVKQALLKDMAGMDQHSDPNHDYMAEMIAGHLRPYPQAMSYLNEIYHKISGRWMDEFEVQAPAVQVEMSSAEVVSIEVESAEVVLIEVESAEAVSIEVESAEAVSIEVESAEVVSIEIAPAEMESSEAESGDFELEEIEVESAAEPEDDKNFYQVPVYFATNRKQDKRYKDEYRSFTGKRSNDMKYGLAQVSMPKTHVPGNLESPRRWLFEKADPNRHIVVLSVEMMDEGGFIVSANDSLKDAETDEALVYIHGYNVSFGGALRLTAQIATDLEFKGIPITYSWPSMAKTLRYNADEANITHGQQFFDDFLEMITQKLNVKKIHILAHSMGNRLATQGMRNLPAHLGKDKIGQVIFASPDVDRDVFAQRAERFAGKAERYTLYINESDLALELSQLIHGFARAGERDGNPLRVDAVDTVDATNIEGSFLGHSFYQRNRTVIADIMSLIQQNLAPTSRPNLLVKGGERVYWEMEK